MILREYIREILSEGVVCCDDLYYHGAQRERKGFTLDHLKFDTANQEGPGIYLSSDKSDAMGYAYPSGFLHVIRVDKLNLATPDDPISKDKMIKLLKMAPDLEGDLTNWDEDPKIAFRALLGAVMNSDGLPDALQTVWNEAYRYEEKSFVENCVALGFDGLFVQRTSNVVHIIVYNVGKLEIVEANQVRGDHDPA